MTEVAKALRSKLCLYAECTFDKDCGCLEAINAALAGEREQCAKEIEGLRAELEAARDAVAGFRELIKGEFQSLAEFKRTAPMEGQ